MDCTLDQWFQNLNQNHLDDLSKHRCLSLTPRVSDSVGLGWGQRICISNKFPGDIDAADLGTTTLRTTALNPLSHTNTREIGTPCPEGEALFPNSREEDLTAGQGVGKFA